MKAPLDWLRDFARTPDDPAAVAQRLASCGFEVASVEDRVIDFEITANRPDCLSVYGLAREASAAYDVDLTPPTLAPAPERAPRQASVRVSIGDPGCARYALGVFDVTVGPSPTWLTDRLTAAGVRPINNIVDVTNYVMLELGHPMHAFDAMTLAGPEIRVRRARPQETLVTLDGQTRALDETMLVIADRERAIAIAGVMGGAPTEVSDKTKRIALESAWFHPATVRATSKRLGLKTEASARFERGADPAAPVTAIRRAQALFNEIGAGDLTGGIIDVHPRVAETRRVSLRRARLRTVLGVEIPDADVVRILGRLGFQPTEHEDGWQTEVPSHRVDVSREADLVEEVARHWGLDRIPPTFPALRTAPKPIAPGVSRERSLRRLLTGAGLQEAVTFSFIERAAALPFVPRDTAVVDIANPLSEKFAAMRPSLLPGLLDALVHSRRREHDDVRLFEVGAAFTAAREERYVGWVLTGARERHWSVPATPVDFFDSLGIAELVGDALGRMPVVVEDREVPWATPGRAARLEIDVDGAATVIGIVGEIRADVAAARGLPAGAPVVAGEMAIDRVAGDGLPAAVRPLPRFPSIVRDLAIVVSDRLPAAEVRGTIRRHAPATLQSVREFDRYQGTGVPEGFVSLAVRLTFRDPARTLTDADVQPAIDAIVAGLAREHGATLRGGERQR